MESDHESSTSSDEEIIEIVRRIARPRIFRERRNPYEIYSEKEFFNRYRLSKNTVLSILEKIGPNLNPTCNRSSPISPMNQLLTCLRFYATGSFQILIGDDANIHKTTVCRIVKRVSHLIASMSKEFITMPTGLQAQTVAHEFESISGFKNVLGCIDGTHIKIQSPGGDNPELYRNRKGYFSLNVQCICDSKLRIRDVDARWHGSVHDSTVFDNSLVRVRLEQNEFRSRFLLGDSAYPCRPYLLTPVANPTNESENKYNQAHIKTRNCIERCFGVLKRRFPCLSNGLRLKIHMVPTVIVATAVLHNVAVNANEIFGIENEGNEEHQDFDINVDDEGHGFAVRRTIINTLFR